MTNELQGPTLAAYEMLVDEPAVEDALTDHIHNPSDYTLIDLQGYLQELAADRLFEDTLPLYGGCSFAHALIDHAFSQIDWELVAEALVDLALRAGG